MTTVKTVIVTLVIGIAVVIAGGVAFVYSGAYYIGADEPHGALMTWLMHTTMQRSVAADAADIEPPADLKAPARLHEGGEHYGEMCVGCHLGPGIKSSEIREGLMPKPPHLAESAKEMPPAKLFWVIKHGVKMTAMPAWGKSHSDEKIWDMVAFIEKLPGMTPQRFKAFTAAGKEGEASDGHAHAHEIQHHE